MDDRAEIGVGRLGVVDQRGDRIAADAREPLAAELENFVTAARRVALPKAGGDDAVRAIRLAHDVLASLQAHRWSADTAPLAAQGLPAAHPSAANSMLRGPHAWHIKSTRQTPNFPPPSR